MAKKRPRNRPVPSQKRAENRRADQLREDRAAEAMTIAWTVSVTGVLIANVILIAAKLALRFAPMSEGGRLFEGIMLLSAAMMGAVSLVLLAIVWRVRKIKPPRGYTVFAICIAVAPIIATAVRLAI